MTTGIQIPQQSTYQGPFIVEEADIMKPLVNKSMLRSQGLYPINTIAKPEDLEHYYWKMVEDLNLNYSLEPYDSPESAFGLQAVSANIPVIHGQMHFATDEMARMNRTKMSVDQRILRAGANIALEEDRITLAGTTENGLTVYGPSDTTNASTAISSNLDVTTMALLNTTLNQAIDQLWDNNIDPKMNPLKLVVSGNVYSLIKGLIDTTSGLTGIQLVDQILAREGGPGSALYRNKYLFATTAVNAKKRNTASPTQSTSKAALFSVNQEYYEVIASRIDIRYGNPDRIKGMDVQYIERWLPLYKTNKAIIYDASVTIA